MTRRLHGWQSSIRWSRILLIWFNFNTGRVSVVVAGGLLLVNWCLFQWIRAKWQPKQWPPKLSSAWRGRIFCRPRKWKDSTRRQARYQYLIILNPTNYIEPKLPYIPIPTLISPFVRSFGSRKMLLFWPDYSLEIAIMTLIGALMTRSFALVELLVRCECGQKQ